MSYADIECSNRITHSAGNTIEPNFESFDAEGEPFIFQQCKRYSVDMKSSSADYFSELDVSNSTHIDETVKRRQNSVSGRGKSMHGDDNVICFQYLYDGQHAETALSDENNNRTVPCSVGVSPELFSAGDQTDLSKQPFGGQSRGLSEDFCQTVVTTIGAQNCSVLESYFGSMQGVDSDANNERENGRASMSISGTEKFHEEKMQNDENYVCSSKEDKQNPFGKHSVYGFESAAHNPIQSTGLSESREVVESVEVKGKKNGEPSRLREGSGIGGVVDEAEILQPQANFQQRSFIHKLGRSEDITNTDLDQVNSMLIAANEGNEGDSRDIQLSQVLLLPRRDKAFYAVDSLPNSSLPTADFMSPNQQTDTSRRISGGRVDICNDMQSLPENVDSTTSVDVNIESHGGRHKQSGVNESVLTENEQHMGDCGSDDNVCHQPGESEDSLRDKEDANSRKRDIGSSMEQQNGDADQSQEETDGNANLGKHIYPWMKESRQNTRRKQSTSSNSSGNGDKSSKRERTAYTNSQLVELEKEFHFNRYLCRPRRIEMAQMLNLTERQIKIWFQNRRMKYKKDQKLKAMPMNSMGRDGGFYHQHHHPSNMNSDALFARSNDHRHYSHSGHMHSADNSYRTLPVDASASMHSGMECSTGGRCYHGHRHHGSHISHDATGVSHQPLNRSSSNSFDGISKAYPAQNIKGNSSGRLTSPSSSSSNDTLSPGNGRSSGGFSSDAGMRSTPCSAETQGMVPSACGFLSHAVSPNSSGNGMDEEASPRLHAEKNNSVVEGRRLINHAGYDASFPSHGLSAFQKRMDDRMPFGNAGHVLAPQMPISNHYLGSYERQKSTSGIAMLAGASSTHSNGNSRYIHNPLESLSDCVHRSPRDFSHQALHFSPAINGGRHPSAEGFSGPFNHGNGAFERSRFERPPNHSPLDYSRSKSSSPRIQPNDAYMNNRLTHL